jgi:hypothetical protein
LYRLNKLQQVHVLFNETQTNSLVFVGATRPSMCQLRRSLRVRVRVHEGICDVHFKSFLNH